MKIAKWDVPDEMIEEYLKWSKFADMYLAQKNDAENMMSEYERGQRWLMCSKRVMEIHRAICEKLKVKYSMDSDDPFYKAFHAHIRDEQEQGIITPKKVKHGR